MGREPLVKLFGFKFVLISRPPGRTPLYPTDYLHVANRVAFHA